MDLIDRIKDFIDAIGLDIKNLLADSHTHANKTALDKISEDVGGEILYNGLPVKTEGELPAGGTTNQILSKIDATDYNVGWVNNTGGTSPWDTATGGINYAGGNVGIGTGTPDQALHIQQAGTGSITALVENTTTIGGAEFQMKEGGGGDWKFKTLQDKLGFKIRDHGRGADRMFFDSLGKVGIGTVSPNSTLDIIGDLRVSDRIGGTATKSAAFDANGQLIEVDLVTGVDLNSQITSSTTLTITHTNKYIPVNSVVGINITINPNIFSTNNQIVLEQTGAGVITLVAGSGMILNGDLNSIGQYKILTLFFKSGTVATVIGGE